MVYPKMIYPFSLLIFLSFDTDINFYLFHETQNVILGRIFMVLFSIHQKLMMVTKKNVIKK